MFLIKSQIYTTNSYPYDVFYYVKQLFIWEKHTFYLKIFRVKLS